jgi:hypothetical protein
MCCVITGWKTGSGRNHDKKMPAVNRTGGVQRAR